MREWMAEVRGNEAQLNNAREILASSSSRIMKLGTQHYLLSEEFRLLHEARQVRDRAVDILGRAKGLARLLGNDLELQLGPVARRHPEGKHDQFVFPEALVVWTRPPLSQPPSHVVQLAERDERVARVLRLLGLPETWDNLYKVLEAVTEDAGRPVWEMGWSSKAQVKLFMSTANNRRAIGDDARHGHEKHAPPKTTMTLIDARILMKRIVGSWIDYKSSPS